MKKNLLWIALAFALLPVLMKLVQYRYWVGSLTAEVYIGVVALMFTILGIWTGSWLLSRKNKHVEPVMVTAMQNETNQPSVAPISNPGLSQREMEVLQLMSEGLSNQEIADKLFVSLNTVKTHSSNLYLKMNVRRRTQAIAEAKNMGIIR
ncbi:MAG: LuxR C-terminal-related transcriptional regulator [Flavobacteriales bacterium]